MSKIFDEQFTQVTFHFLIVNSEPTFDKDCIIIDVPDNTLIGTQDIKWITYDCATVSDSRPICQYSYEMSHVLPEKIGT